MFCLLGLADFILAVNEFKPYPDGQRQGQNNQHAIIYKTFEWAK